MAQEFAQVFRENKSKPLLSLLRLQGGQAGSKRDASALENRLAIFQIHKLWAALNVRSWPRDALRPRMDSMTDSRIHSREVSGVENIQSGDHCRPVRVLCVFSLDHERVVSVMAKVKMY